MEPSVVAAAIALGFGAGVASGLVGVGGGIIFVPVLAIFLGLGQLEAEATSLLAMIPVAVVGAAQQQRYGNLRLRDGVLIGALSPIGVVVGTTLAHALPERALSLMFAAVLLFFAYRLARRAIDGS